MRSVSDLSILLATVNISRSEICQKIPKLILLLAAAGVVIYLSWTRGKMSPSNVELCCHGAVRDFFAEAGIRKLVTFAIFR
jgi:hypothetical protein